MKLQISNLSKTFANGVKALAGIDLEISQGMFGLLGPNGAGKSTLMRILATLQEADSGQVMLDQLDVLKDKSAVRQILGYLPQEFGVYPRVDAGDMLNHLALLKGVISHKERKELVDYLLHQTNLYEHRNKRISSFSGGMKQRFGIAQALIGNPLLIIVDEPTAGLDPMERNRFLNLLGEVGEHVIVILSTHIVDDVKEMCSDMAVMDKGQILYKGTTKDALLQIKGNVWETSIEKSEIETFSAQYEVLSTRLFSGKPLVHIYNDSNPGEAFVQAPENLEDFYFKKIKK
ncbi:MAG: ABC transporter ATP-binding protein [Cytophagales bacterium]|nr:ABC transporter ATP-binding protein [Cytophagales bacterium]